MSNEKLGAEQGRETLQAIAQEIVANLGSCDASSDLGFKVIWATLDRHFGTGPKQAEQAHHARGAGRELEIRLDEAHRWNAQRVHHVGAPVKDWGIRRIDELEIALAGEPGADTGTTVAEELSGMLAERMIKLAIKIQGPYATFGPPESLERRKKSHQERIEELTGMLTTEFAECLERGTTPPEGLEFPWAAETMRLIDVLTPETKGKAFDPDWFLLRQRLEEFERRAATQRAPVEQGRESTRETEITKLQASLTPEERQGNESWGHKADCVLLCSCGYEKPYPLSDLMKDYADYLKWRMAQREQPMPAPDHAREGAMREALQAIRELLSKGSPYAIHRSDGQNLEFHELITIGNIFERAEAALLATPPYPRKDLALEAKLEEAKWWMGHSDSGEFADDWTKRIAELEQRLAEMRGAKR